MDIEAPEKQRDTLEKLKLIQLSYAGENCFRHVYEFLDFNKEGHMNKSQLQVVCANVCRVLDISYFPEDLEQFIKDSKTLSIDEFLSYVGELVKQAQGKNKDAVDISYLLHRPKSSSLIIIII